MILEIIVRPKAFYTSSTDLTVRSWVCRGMVSRAGVQPVQVYEFEDATNVFRHHQHSVGAIALEGDTCKLGQSFYHGLWPTAGHAAALQSTPFNETERCSSFDRLPLWVVLALLLRF